MGRRFLRSLLVGSIAALTVAAIDAASGYVDAGTRFRSPSYAAAGLALVTALVLAFYVALRWLLVAPFAWGRSSDHATSVGTAMGVAALFLVHDPGTDPSTLSGLFDIAIDTLLALALGVSGYELALAEKRRQGLTRARIAGRALPFVAALSALAAWVGFARIDDVSSIRFVLLMVAFLVTAGVASFVAAIVPRSRWRLGVVAVFAATAVPGAAGLLVLSGGIAPARRSSGPVEGRIPRVIVLTVDTLRRDALSCYGSTHVQTPNIDRIAAGGCLLRNAQSTSSWTLPAFASMLTGLSAREHGVFTSTAVLPDTVATLAERFRDAGYTTHALIANGILAPHRGFAQGFAQYHMGDAAAPPVNLGERLVERLRHRPLTAEATSTELTDAAITWLRGNKDHGFLLWLHYLDPHLPYAPAPAFVTPNNMHPAMGYELDISSATRPSMDLFGDPARRLWARSLYDGETRYVDAEIGRLFAALDAEGMYEGTLIVFAADHGEEFWDHDGFEHGHTLYQELTGVPLIIKPPGPYAPRVVETFVGLQDVAPTVLALCGLDAVDAPRARSLAGVIAGDSTAAIARPLFATGTLFRSNFESVVFDGWKYIRSATTGREELFRLADDPLERRSLVLDHPDVAARGRALIDEQQRASRVFREERGIENPALKLDPEEIARLRALGYL